MASPFLQLLVKTQISQGKPSTTLSAVSVTFTLASAAVSTSSSTLALGGTSLTSGDPTCPNGPAATLAALCLSWRR